MLVGTAHSLPDPRERCERCERSEVGQGVGVAVGLGVDIGPVQIFRRTHGTSFMCVFANQVAVPATIWSSI